MRAVVVDDERLARDELRYLLRDHPDVQIVADAGTVTEAVRVIDRHRPDVLFLDVQLRGESGFDLVERIEHPCRIVFVTGHDEYALRAFEINALDYVMKPVTPDRLARAIRRLHDDAPRSVAANGRLGENDTLFLESRTRSYFVRVGDFVCILAAGDYSEVVTVDGRRALVLSPLKEWEERLPSNRFARIHRSSIVNVDHVREITPIANNAYLVYIEGMDEPIRMSRRYAAKVKEQLS